MATLRDKFTVDDIEEITSKINHIFYQATHWETTSKSRLAELQLLYVIDNLCRLSAIMCNVIEQELNGHIETPNPKDSINRNLSSAANGIQNFIQSRNIKFNND